MRKKGETIPVDSGRSGAGSGGRGGENRDGGAHGIWSARKGTDWWVVVRASRGLSWSIRGAVVHVKVDFWGPVKGCGGQVRGGEC